MKRSAANGIRRGSNNSKKKRGKKKRNKKKEEKRRVKQRKATQQRYRDATIAYFRGLRDRHGVLVVWAG